MSDFRNQVVTVTAHRPWPMPRGPWVLRQTWHDLLFAHWPVAVSSLRHLVPPAFEIEECQGSAWIGVVPFGMTDVGMRELPSLPGLSSMAELNVRTYVHAGGRPGVFFFSLDGSNAGLSMAARWLTNLPYVPAAMEVTREGEAVRFVSARPDGRAALDATYEPAGPPMRAAAGSPEAFLVERYCLYHLDRRRRPYRLEIHHPPWELQPSACAIRANTMGAVHGLPLDGAPALVHFARRQDVVAWLPRPLDRVS